MTVQKKPAPEKGVKRIWKALFYSISGFRLAFQDEAAFRQELGMVAILSIICFFLPIEPSLKVAIIICHVLVLIVELLNTAVEAIVDKASPEYHHEAKKAKDTGSAAVLLSLGLLFGVWCYAIYTII